MSITITPISTGSIRVRPSQMTQPAGNVLLRRLRFLLDRSWTEPIPIYCFLIRHPAGNILFDTGESPDCLLPGYYPWWQIGHHCVSMDIGPEHGLGQQLAGLGLDPKEDIATVVLSHLHSDHAGGLGDVYGKPTVYTGKQHWDVFKDFSTATMEGGNPRAWPADFEPTILKPDGPAIGPWPHSYPVTEDGRIVCVDTPGHVPGHLSMIVFGDEATYFLTGDATYNLPLLDEEKTDGINTDPVGAIQSLKKIKEFCRTREVVVLPSHEYDTVRRLEQNVVYRPSAASWTSRQFCQTCSSTPRCTTQTAEQVYWLPMSETMMKAGHWYPCAQMHTILSSVAKTRHQTRQ